MIRPDYDRSIVNLMGSVAEAFGAAPACAPLEELADAGLAQAQTVLLLVLDGLGRHSLARHPDSALSRHCRGTLSSVFPSTTATAITSFATGLPPAAHGVTGWFMYLRELGLVTTILPFTSRLGDQPLTELVPGSERLIQQPSLYRRLDAECHVLMPFYIADSDYTRATTDGAARYQYRDLGQFVERCVELCRRGRRRRYVYAYWPFYDGECHQHGVDSPQADAHFRQLDQAMAQLFERLQGQEVAVLATADHGLIDTAPQRVIDITDHPALRDTLLLPPCGEPRAAYCYLRHGAEADFLGYLEQHLTHACEVRPSRELIAEGYFGPGPRHPALAERVGDYTLLMRDDYVVTERPPRGGAFPMIGVHGGLSPRELEVPLILADG